MYAIYLFVVDVFIRLFSYLFIYLFIIFIYIYLIVFISLVIYLLIYLFISFIYSFINLFIIYLNQSKTKPHTGVNLSKEDLFKNRTPTLAVEGDPCDFLIALCKVCVRLAIVCSCFFLIWLFACLDIINMFVIFLRCICLFLFFIFLYLIIYLRM
jgi:hypothetical protein